MGSFKKRKPAVRKQMSRGRYCLEFFLMQVLPIGIGAAVTRPFFEPNIVWLVATSLVAAAIVCAIVFVLWLRREGLERFRKWRKRS
jgi:hypothetical protein